jgi:EpsI family protein
MRCSGLSEQLDSAVAIQRRAVLLLGLMSATALCAAFVRPVSVVASHPPLTELIPRSFAEWSMVPDLTQNVINPQTVNRDEVRTDQPYTDVLMRVYEDARGDRIMLAIAYGGEQRQEVKIHRPELCYVAQGFEVVSRRGNRIVIGGKPSVATRLLVKAPGRTEIVSYWIRIGDIQSAGALQTRLYLFNQGLRGRVVDGVLVRASQIVGSANAPVDGQYQLQERFLADLVASVDPTLRNLLIRG